MSGFRRPDFVASRPPRKLFFKPLANRVLGTRRKQIIAGGIALVLIGGFVGALAWSAQAAVDHKVAVAIAQKNADAKAAAIAKAEEVRQTALDLKTAQESAVAALARSVNLAAEAASFAEVSALSAVKTAQNALTALDSEGSTATADLRLATTTLNNAVSDLGTAADAEDRRYVAAMTAAGNTLSDDAGAINSARDLCAGLVKDYSDPSTAVDHFIGRQFVADVTVVTIYCPEYLSAVNAAAGMIPGDGGYAVAASASPFGTNPQVIAAGTYKTRGSVSDCYWEVNDSHGGIIRNNFTLSAPGGVTVQLRPGQGFTTQGCGSWAYG